MMWWNDCNCGDQSAMSGKPQFHLAKVGLAMVNKHHLQLKPTDHTSFSTHTSSLGCTQQTNLSRKVEDSGAFLTRYPEPKLSRDVALISLAEQLVNCALNLDYVLHC
jgi:hypothetical protein